MLKIKLVWLQEVFEEWFAVAKTTLYAYTLDN
jgi:hypothetical protein